MSEPLVRAPVYLTRFRCIGSACEDHCCGGWRNVDVDVETYGRYRQIDDAELAQTMRRHLALNEEPTAGPEDYALIEVPEGGGCPFLTAERLCAIQGRLGEALLPTGCDTFPRQATLVDGTLDLAGRFSCPEVVRLALLAPDGLDVAVVEPERRLRERGRYWVEAPRFELREGDPRRHYHHLRGRSLELLRRREVSLEARLRALGEALGALDGRPGFGRDDVEREFAGPLARLPELQRAVDAAPGPAGPHALLLERVRPWFAMRGVPPRYRACLERLRTGLELPDDPAAPLDGRVTAAYAGALPRLRAYLENRPYVLEHAVANQVLIGNFPFHPSHSFLEEYAILVCRHGLLMLHLVGAAAAEGALSDNLVVETVQAFDKYADGPEYWRRTLDLLRRHGAFSLPSLAALLAD